MGYFGLRDDIKYWSVTCKRCKEIINFAHYDEHGHQYDQNCVIAMQCPRCLEKRRYLPVEIWKRSVTTSPIGTGNYFITEPLFIQFVKR